AHRKSNRDADKQNTYAHQQHESYDRPKFRQLQPSLVPTLHNCLRQSCCAALFALRARSNLRTSLLAFLLARRMPFSFLLPATLTLWRMTGSGWTIGFRRATTTILHGKNFLAESKSWPEMARIL